MDGNARFKNGHARVETRVLKTLACRNGFWTSLRETQEGCGGLRGETPAAFPQKRPIVQQPFSLPENAQTLAGIAFRAARKSVKNLPAASKLAGRLFQQGISDSQPSRVF